MRDKKWVQNFSRKIWRQETTREPYVQMWE